MSPSTADEERLFPIQEYGYSTGFCEDGRQVVMGLLCPYLVAFFFDPAGNPLGKERVPWDHAAPEVNSGGPYAIYDEAFEAATERQLRAWQAELGFRPGTIRVKAFMDEDELVGMELLPEHYQDLETVEGLTDEERQEKIRQRDEWLARGDFVWWWGKDHYMSHDGEVEST